MNIVQLPIEELTPYENNPRNNKKAIKYVANSIHDFGFKSPIILDTNKVIICGHTRYEAAKVLGYTHVPCIIASDLTEEQVKAYRLADNKVAEMAKWDYDLLSFEIQDLSFDMEDFGFDVERLLTPAEEKENERERTMDAYNLHDYDSGNVEGFYQMPIITRTYAKPSELIGFNYVKTNKKKEGQGVHFFIDDYQFERIWNDPDKYVDMLVPYECVLTPDFSLYTEMPMAMKIWNVYRSRLIGQILQQNGANVVPTLSWCERDTFAFCFDGIEPGGTVAVSTIGVKRSDDAYHMWAEGMDEAIRKLKPEHVIVYGGDIGYQFPCEVTYIQNAVTERMKKSGR